MVSCLFISIIKVIEVYILLFSMVQVNAYCYRYCFLFFFFLLHLIFIFLMLQLFWLIKVLIVIFIFITSLLFLFLFEWKHLKYRKWILNFIPSIQNLNQSPCFRRFWIINTFFIITLEQIFIRNVRHSLINRWTERIAISGQMTEGDHKSGKALRPPARSTNVPTVPTPQSTFTY